MPRIAVRRNLGGVTTINGTLNTKPDSQYTVQFFSNPATGDTIDGTKYIGEQTVTTNSDGNASFSYPSGRAVAGGDTVTATATGAEGTSEFSGATTVTVQ